MCVCVCVCVCVCGECVSVWCVYMWCVRACVLHAICSMGHMCNIYSCNLLCSPTVTPPMYLLHKYTHIYTYTYTYIHACPLYASYHLPSVVFVYISPLCLTQGSKVADVVTTSALGQLKVTSYHRTMFIACARLLISIILYFYLF